MNTIRLIGHVLDFLVFGVLFNKLVWFIGLFVALLIISHNAKAMTLECFTDEPRRYEFNIGAQKVGSYRVDVKHETGKLAGLTYSFVIRDVSSLKNYDDYLTKRFSVGVPYTITYALKCKPLE